MGLGAILDFSIGNIISAVWSIVRWLGMLICSVIYGLVSWIYQVFMTLAQVNILTASDKIETIYERVTIILTIIMVFYITFQFVKYVVQPDTMTDKEKGAGNVIWRLILAIIMIAFVPTIFTKAYELQGRIINNQVIPKIILGKTDMDYNTLGSDFSADMMGMFLYVNEEACPTMEAPECIEAQKVVDEQLRQMRENKRFSVGSLGSVFFSGIKTNVNDEGEAVTLITYNGLLAIVVGCFILYVLVLYSIDLGTRYAQLIFLQVTAPIAIIGYVSPKKDGIFPKWLKQCLTTYLDLFIRLVLLYFILFIIGLLHDEIITGDLFKGIEDARKGLAYVALVMGLLAFAHKAPKMLKELFPSSGGAASIGFGLKSEDRDKAIKGTWNAGKRVVGGVAGAAVGVVGGIGAAGGLKAIKAMTAGKKASAIYSTLKAGTRGLKAGAAKQGGPRKGMQAARDSYQKDIDTKKAGGDPFLADFGLAKEKGSNTPFNLRNASDLVKKQDRRLKEYDIPKTSMDAITKQVEEFKQYKIVKLELETAKNDPTKTAAEIKTIESKMKATAQFIRDKVVSQNGVISQSDLNRTFTVTYDKIGDDGFALTDANGHKIQGTMEYKFDSGDQGFADPLNTIARSEYDKVQSTDELRNVMVDIGNGPQSIGSLTVQEYTKYLHKIKDAMPAEKEKFERSSEFEQAHANAKNSGGSNK